MKRAEIIGMMVEGMSVRAIVRLTGVSKTTILKLLEDCGEAFSEYQDQAFHDLPCKKLQVDEIWAFNHSKQRNVATAKRAPSEAGDIWTRVAIDADSKLIPSWLVSNRGGDAAKVFISDLAGRLSSRIQLTSDGHRAYLEAVEEAFGADIDYAQLVKVFGEAPHPPGRYSPGICVGAEKHAITGRPDPKHISTSYAEQANLSIRMHDRRFTRLTNAFSKKAENHAHSVALNFMYYNFVRIHQTSRCTPAMAAGVTAKLWELADMVRVLEDWEAQQTTVAH